MATFPPQRCTGWYRATATIFAVLLVIAVAGLLLHDHLPVRTPARLWVVIASSCFVVVGGLSL